MELSMLSSHFTLKTEACVSKMSENQLITTQCHHSKIKTQ